MQHQEFSRFGVVPINVHEQRLLPLHRRFEKTPVPWGISIVKPEQLTHLLYGIAGNIGIEQTLMYLAAGKVNKQQIVSIKFQVGENELIRFRMQDDIFQEGFKAWARKEIESPSKDPVMPITLDWIHRVVQGLYGEISLDIANLQGRITDARTRKDLRERRILRKIAYLDPDKRFTPRLMEGALRELQEEQQ